MRVNAQWQQTKLIYNEKVLIWCSMNDYMYLIYAVILSHVWKDMVLAKL
jgi:hypothetical protein